MRQSDFERMVGEMECVLETITKFVTEWKDELKAFDTDFYTVEQNAQLKEVTVEFEKSLNSLAK